MAKLSIIVPNDSAIEAYLFQQSVLYPITKETSDSVVFSYEGVYPPLAKISLLLAMFDPSEYTISKSTTGISFFVFTL